MSSSGRYDSNYYRSQGSSSPLTDSPLLSSGAYAGNPTSRYGTGPFSYQNPSRTARCTSSYRKFRCLHASVLETQRVAGCAACEAASPQLCTPTPIEVSIPAKCINYQPHHRRDENGNWTRSTRQDRIQDACEEFRQSSNNNDYAC
jgi:hypothetical protein